MTFGRLNRFYRIARALECGDDMNLLNLARAALAEAVPMSIGAAEAPDESVTLPLHRNRQWRISYPNAAAMTVLFTPPATRAEVAAVYPDANVTPIPDEMKRAATVAETEELRELIELVFADVAQEERSEALTAARADVEAAFVLLRTLRDDYAKVRGPHRTALGR